MLVPWLPPIRLDPTYFGRGANKIRVAWSATFSISVTHYVVIEWRSVNFHPLLVRRSLSK
jgi:hypothetical protein